jgi:hypothetical protein
MLGVVSLLAVDEHFSRRISTNSFPRASRLRACIQNWATALNLDWSLAVSTLNGRAVVVRSSRDIFLRHDKDCDEV